MKKLNYVKQVGYKINLSATQWNENTINEMEIL